MADTTPQAPAPPAEPFATGPTAADLATTVEVPGGFQRVTAASPSRYAINAAEVRPAPHAPGYVYLSATDGRCAAVSLVPGLCPGPELIPAAILPTKQAGDTLTRVNGLWRAIKAGRVLEVEPTADHAPSFPPIYDVLPDVGALRDGAPGYPVAIRINADLFHACACAITTPEDRGVTVLVPREPEDKSKRGPGPVVLVGPRGRFGILMPVTFDGDPRAEFMADAAAYRASFGKGAA